MRRYKPALILAALCALALVPALPPAAQEAPRASRRAPRPTPTPAPAAPAASEPPSARSIALGAVSAEARAAAGFDAAQSRGVFIGVNLYTATSGVKPPNLKSCVNDAVDLAAAFQDLGLIEPSGITLALSGEPSKPDSVAALERLRQAGATLAPDARRDTMTNSGTVD